MIKNWEERWTEDIEYLKKSLITKHKNLFFNVGCSSINLEFADLNAGIGVIF